MARATAHTVMHMNTMGILLTIDAEKDATSTVSSVGSTDHDILSKHCRVIFEKSKKRFVISPWWSINTQNIE